MVLDAHLHFQDISSPEILRAIFRHEPSGNEGFFFCNATSPDDWPGVQAIARQSPSIIPFFGVHPRWVGKAGEGWEEALEKYIGDQAAGVGEIGLDRARGSGNFETQKIFFSRQVRMAVRRGKPFSVHSVRAWGALLDILKDEAGTPARFMVHAFRGPHEVLEELLSLGAYISFSYRGLRTGGPEIFDRVREVPPHRLLLETDYPYTEPVERRGALSPEDYFTRLRETYEMAARARGLEAALLEEEVCRNGKVLLYGTSAR